jgi:HK97 gp10 family phage protein
MKITWNPETVTAEIEKKAMDRLETAAGYVMAMARQKFPLHKPADMPGRKSKEPWRSMDTGKMRRTIRTARLKGDPKLNVRVYMGNRDKVNGQYWAHILEFGSVKLAARPTLRPSLNEVKGRVKSIVQGGE